MCCRVGDSSGGESPALNSGHSRFNPREFHVGLTVDKVALSFLLCVCVCTRTVVFPGIPNFTGSPSPSVYQLQIQTTSVIATPTYDNLVDRHLSASYPVGACCYHDDCQIHGALPEVTVSWCRNNL
jgi:hypothetical protein